MKNSYLSAAMALAATAFLTACSSTQTVEHEEHVEESPSTAPYVVIHHTVLFAFDSYEAPEKLDLLIEPHVDYLLKYPNRSVLLQGQTDLVGEDGYNYVLGQRRAMTVKEAFVNAGIPESQIRISSIASSNSKRRLEPRAVHIVY